MSFFITQQRWIVITALSTVVVLGALFRLYHLDKRTISHPEMYTPGIELPYELSNPRPRLTLSQVLTKAVADEPHPPAYYIFMLCWTKLFGTGIVAIRLPSVLFGLASILLIYILCNIEEDKWTGLLASGMLAFNGLHIFWSQEARMYSMACFLGLLSTFFLVLLSKRSARQPLFKFLYSGSTLVGLATVVYFWPIFVTQMLWILTSNWRKKVSPPGMFRLQIFIFILASPLIAIAAYQSRRSSYLGEDLLTKISQFLQFGFLFEPDSFIVNPNSVPVVAAIFLILMALFLLVLGILSEKKQAQEIPIAKSPPPVVMTLTGIFVFLGILVFAKLAHAKDPSRTTLIVSASIIPLLMPLIDLLLRRYWNQFQNFLNLLYDRVVLLNHLNSLNVLLAILPVAMIAGVSLFVPLFSSRGLLLYLPFFIIILSRGLVTIVRYRVLWVVLVVILVGTHAFSVVHNHNRYHSIRDYKALAEQWIPKIESSDLIFVRRHWAITPIFYYLNANRYQFIGRNYSENIYKHPDSRVWVLCVPGIPMTQEVKDAINSYQVQERVDAFNIWTLLYVKD